tara:strand:- start:35110 stop:35601 length:492 start_codon:yes stop_codon:yes gene_type:complete
MNTFFKPPGCMFNGLPGPYYISNNSPQAAMSPAQIAAMNRQSALAAEETNRRNSELQLKLEAQRNSYATALADREKQNELELQRQAEALESGLAEVEENLEEEDQNQATITGFQNSLLAGMGMGVAGAPSATGEAPTGGGMQGGSPAGPEFGTPIYGARARPV